MRPGNKPTTLICIGKDCRRDKGFEELRDALRSCGKVGTVKCQDLCSGPVAGVELDGRMQWFEKVRKPRHRGAVVELASGDRKKVPKVLEDRWARKRSGKVKR